MKIHVKRGLDIPFSGRPQQILHSLPKPEKVALNLDPFDDLRFKPHVKVGDSVKLGQPIAENKAVLGQMFVAPAAGKISELKRGLKRRLLDIVIDVDEKEESFVHEPPKDDRDSILEFFLRAGVFPHIRLRPFDLIADPNHLPEAIFIRAVEFRPYAPSACWQMEGRLPYFRKGLEILKKIAPVHLAHSVRAKCDDFRNADGIEKHVVSGYYPGSNSSVHIHHALPIRKATDYRWVIDVDGVVTIGKLLLKQNYYVDRIVGLGGPVVKEPAFFAARMGYPIGELCEGRVHDQLVRYFSGDPLSGSRVDLSDFLGFFDKCVSVLPVNTKRQAFHFFRLGRNKFSATRAYLSGFFPKKSYDFTTNQHGEERAFIDPSLYDKVMPMRIPTVPLVKALMAQDFELAELLGVYEVAPEDFILPTFICPSKIEMVDIVKQGIRLFAKEMGH